VVERRNTSDPVQRAALGRGRPAVVDRTDLDIAVIESIGAEIDFRAVTPVSAARRPARHVDARQPVSSVRRRAAA